MKKRLIYICSPCRGHDGNYEHNITMAQEYCQTIMMTMPGWVPVAPHVYFTQFLDDTVEPQRSMGIEAGLALLDRCDAMIVFYMQNPSSGMKKEIRYAEEKGIPVLDAAEVFRDIPGLFSASKEVGASAAAPVMRQVTTEELHKAVMANFQRSAGIGLREAT